jgi:NAD(P)-dependent dehydrogenase (short-subunit alcohol dehydrogenase family)
MGRLEGRVAVVTGAANGIGRACAIGFAGEGAKVVLGDIDDAAGVEAAAAIGDGAHYKHCDVTSEAEVEALVACAGETFGGLDIMLNNAGAIGARGSLMDMSQSDFDGTMNLLFRSAFFGMKHAGRVMADQGHGSILNTASIAAHDPGNGPHIYGAAKAALVALTKRFALEVGEKGVRVNAICPGGIPTDLVLDALNIKGGKIPEPMVKMMDQMALLRAGKVEDVVHAALFLASDDASWVTGQALTVDGGESVGPKWSMQKLK